LLYKSKFLKRMKIAGTISLLITSVIIAACSTVKKTSTTMASPAPVPAAAVNPTTDSYLFTTKPADGTQTPGNEELSAIQIQYKDVTLDKLKEGHAIYTTGACVGCHGTINIYQYEVTQWKLIIDDMAQRANISDEQKRCGI
jgi:uncharacterized lipoprotein YajG